MMTPQFAGPEVVAELTKNYLHKLTDSELQEHFIKFSNKFTTSLNEGSEHELNVLQSYLRLIAAEMSERMKDSKK